jgi:hypothetical protein
MVDGLRTARLAGLVTPGMAPETLQTVYSASGTIIIVPAAR